LQLEKARTESLTDGLTGIYNRKAFDHKIGELVQKNTVSQRAEIIAVASLLVGINFRCIFQFCAVGCILCSNRLKLLLFFNRKFYVHLCMNIA